MIPSALNREPIIANACPPTGRTNQKLRLFGRWSKGTLTALTKKKIFIKMIAYRILISWALAGLQKLAGARLSLYHHLSFAPKPRVRQASEIANLTVADIDAAPMSLRKS